MVKAPFLTMKRADYSEKSKFDSHRTMGVEFCSRVSIIGIRESIENFFSDLTRSSPKTAAWTMMTMAFWTNIDTPVRLERLVESAEASFLLLSHHESGMAFRFGCVTARRRHLLFWRVCADDEWWLV